MKNLLIPVNLQFFAEDDFASELSDVLGVSAEEKEVADPSSNDNNEPDVEDQQDNQDDQEKAQDETSKRDLEKDSAFAAQRREKEAIERKLKEAEDKQKAKDEWYKSKYSEQYGINSEADFFDYMERQEQEALKQKADEGDQDAIAKLIEQTVSQKVSVEVQKARQQAEIQAKLDIQLSAEFKDLNEAYGTKVEAPQDILNLPNGKEIGVLMRTKKADGSFFTAKEAYKMANVDILLSETTEKIKQQTKNELSGFKHTKTDQKSTGDADNITLPPEVLAEYEKMGIKPDMNHIKRVMRN